MHTQNVGAAASWLKETRKGYLRIAVLTLLSRKPHHGYEIMKEIKNRTHGFWRPTPGGIYPILQNLEELRYIKGEWDPHQKRRRKTYRITKTGRAILKQALTRQNEIAERMSDLFREFVKDVLDIKSAPEPPIPNVFSAFLEEGKERHEDTIDALQARRSHIGNAIENLKREQQAIDKQLVKIKLEKKPTSSEDKRELYPEKKGSSHKKSVHQL
jgi:DNA-binding PadR family transcriptional regulator